MSSNLTGHATCKKLMLAQCKHGHKYCTHNAEDLVSVIGQGHPATNLQSEQHPQNSSQSLRGPTSIHHNIAFMSSFCSKDKKL